MSDPSKSEHAATIIGFKFKHLVKLLETLDAARERIHKAAATKQPPSAQSNLTDVTRTIIQAWFDEHASSIIRHGSPAVAILSCLLLDRRPDRVYWLQEKKLANVLCKVLWLPPEGSRALTLHQWKKKGLDLATCLEQEIMRDTENDPPLPEHEVTLEEIDTALQELAGRSELNVKAEEVLRPIFRRLHSSEAKWLVRIILKSYDPVEIPDHVVLNCFHFLLPQIIRLRNSIPEAVNVLGQREMRKVPYYAPQDLRRQYFQQCSEHIKLKIRVPFQKQKLEQARGIGNCCTMAGQRTMSVERKYDGWYVQVHIDMSRSRDNRIHLISRRGKNLTTAAFGLHDALEEGLRLNEPDCLITRNCIVEVEMVVWNRKKKAIEEFCKVRKHILIHGHTIGTAMDSPKSADEQLMAIFHECLMVDDRNLVFEPHRVRRQQLESIVRPVEGLAQLGVRQVINFGSSHAEQEFWEYFEYSLAERWEGLVLKGCDDYYFSTSWYRNPIKLKRDYIKGGGDRADLCLIGGRRDYAEAQRLGGAIRWTTVHLACLKNKRDVIRHKAKAVYLILNEISPPCISKDMLLTINTHGIGRYVAFDYESDCFNVEIDQNNLRQNPPTHLFQKPFVVEAFGAGYEKPQDASYYTLRFARVDKLHLSLDRPVTKTDSFDELQELARKSREPPTDKEKEEREWINKTIQAGPVGDRNLYQSSPSQETPSTICESPVSSSAYTPTPSARKSNDSRSSPPPTTPFRPQDEQDKHEYEVIASQQAESMSCPSTASISSSIRTLLQGVVEPIGHSMSPSPLVKHAVALEHNEIPRSLPAIVISPSNVSTATASPSPGAIDRVMGPPEVPVGRPPSPVFNIPAPDVVKGVKHKASWSRLSPEARKFLKFATPTDAADNQSDAFGRLQTGNLPNLKPSNPSELPPRHSRSPLAALENVPVWRGPQPGATDLIFSDKPPRDARHDARKRAEDKSEPEMIDLTWSPDNQRSHIGHTGQTSPNLGSSALNLMQPPPTPINATGPPSTPSRLLDITILKVLNSDPLVTDIHGPDHNVIWAKLHAVVNASNHAKITRATSAMAIAIVNAYATLPCTSTAPAQKRMIYFFNKEVRHSLFESSPMTKTPREVLGKYDSKQHWAAAQMISVEKGSAKVLCEPVYERGAALYQLEKLRVAPETFVVSPM